METKQITLCGAGHWSTQGDISNKLWYWWVESGKIPKNVDDYYEKFRKHDVTGEQRLPFTEEIKLLLPKNWEKKLGAPDMIPGGVWSIRLPLSKFTEPEKAEKILKKYFPNIFQK